MKLQEGHHIETEGLTKEQYEAFCEECIRQGFGKGEYGGIRGWKSFSFVGLCDDMIFHCDTAPEYFERDKLLTYEQAMSSVAVSDEADLNAKRDELKQARKTLEEARQRVNKLEQWFVDELELTP